MAGSAAAQGAVSAICSTDQAWCEMAATEFSKATGLRVQQTHKATGEALAQLRAEAANPKTDLWWGGTGDPFLQAAEIGLLEPYRPDYLDQLHGWSVRQYAMTQNRVGGFYTSAIGFGFNTELLRKKKLPEPHCWADLVKPGYKGEIEISHPVSSGTAYTILAGLVQLLGEDAAFDYMKQLHRNVTTYTRSGQAQAPNVAKGEVAVGVSFIFGFEGWRYNKYPVKTAAPCEGTSYEIGGIALVKGGRNPAGARRYYDWLMSPAGQSIGGKANSLQVPANKTFKTDPRIPSLDDVKLIKYDFEKYGRAAERRRLLERWTREVESLPR
ncbi:ABC transporter substrate-binding protein [Variovorax terrae]|uniref:ABC transporter substrate-binding protein n=1 Tax=Variovorax terrae TaxID=2923278 RepID=A0A9X1VZ93_9BURK|nr:ABC transporter substrate-binding protein [Variovorax terrae]MCJ0764777.1 ABC transporter substrate-binding protein [Variovorax terrae]